MAPDASTDAPADAPADTCTFAPAHAPADASAKPSTVAAALIATNSSANAEPVALANSDARKPYSGARLCSDAAPHEQPDEQPVGSSGLLLLGRRLRRLYGGVDVSGLLERKRSVREQLR